MTRIELFLMWLFTLTNVLTMATPAIPLGRAFVNEFFSTKIDQRMFNWTIDSLDQIDYRLTLSGYPNLPTWLRYQYSFDHHAAYLYGTPPESLSGQEVRLDMVGLNRKTYEIKTYNLSLFITRKHNLPKNSIHMKIDNLNWVDMMDPGRVENLKNIFKEDLWPESTADLHVSFMESALFMGVRKPVEPTQRDGVVVHLASRAQFSDRLIELQEEVRPLYKIASCDYKRTSVQTVFENGGFKLDWCAFRIVNDADQPNHKVHESERSVLKRRERWYPMAKDDVPARSYYDEVTFAFAIPGIVLILLVTVLTTALCLHHDKIYDSHSEYFFDNIFHICTDLRDWNKYSNNQHQTVQMVQYSDVSNQPTTTLKSLKDINSIVDNISELSQSPSNSIYRLDTSPIAGNSTLRPRPPPYKTSAIHRNGVQI